MPALRTVPTRDASARERLASAALDLFNSKGYAATTVREIVASARVTQPVLYYHFKNKEGIYLHLMEDAFAEFAATVQQAVARPGGAVERLHALLDHTYRVFLDHIAAARLMYAIYYGPPQGAPRFDFDRVHDSFREAVREIVQSGVRSGEFRAGDVDEMAWVVIGVFSVAVELHLCHPQKSVSPKTLARMLDVALEGLRRPRRPAKTKRSSR